MSAPTARPHIEFIPAGSVELTGNPTDSVRMPVIINSKPPEKLFFNWKGATVLPSAGMKIGSHAINRSLVLSNRQRRAFFLSR